MPTDLTAPSPWEPLRLWPGWRGLEESLLELESLLRRVDAAGGAGGSGALEIADTIAILLTEPESLLSSGHWQSSFAIPRASAASRQVAPPDFEELPQLLRELACWVADAPLLLEGADSSRNLGQRLAAELPRYWQSRLSGLHAGLRQALQSASRKGAQAAPPPREGARSRPVAPPPPDPQPTTVVVRWGPDYTITLPEDADQELLDRACQELLYAILRDLGPDAARLHLLLLTRPAGAPLDYDDVHRALGLHRHRAISRRAKDERCHLLLQQLSGIRLVLLNWQQAPDDLRVSRTTKPLWELKLQHYGQTQLEERRGGVVTRGQDWTVQWTEPALPISLELRERLLRTEAWLHGPQPACRLAMAILLDHFAGESERRIDNRALLSLAGLPLDGKPWQALRSAARGLSGLGWKADWTEWPADLDTPTDAFLDAGTIYRRVEET